MNLDTRRPLGAGWLLILALVVLAGCSQEQTIEPGFKGGGKVAAGALAQVGEDQIDEREFRRYEAAIQTQHRSLKEGIEKYREHLMTLIDVKLMVREAEERGLAKNPELVKALELEKHTAMIQAYLREKVGLQIEITEDELRANFESHPARHAVRGAHILLRDRAQADSVHAEIESGRATFAEMARKHSLDKATAENGGEFASYYAFDRVSDQIYGQVFSLAVGQYSQPFRTPQGWEIAMVVDKKLVPFEKYRTVIQRATFMQKIEDLKRGHIAELITESNMRSVPENLTRFIAAWNDDPGRPQLSADELEAPLYRYDGGIITLQQASNLLHNSRLGRAQIDSALIEEKIHNRGAPDLLLGIAAEQAGYDTRLEVREKVGAEKERLLLEGLWDELLEVKLQESEEEARAHYDANPRLYTTPEEIVIQEILVADEEEAQALLAQVQDGEDMADLATQHSIRRYSDENGGLYALRAFERIVYKEVMDVAMSVPENQLQGPIKVMKPLPASLRDPRPLDQAYSIFKVLQRLPERVQTYELSKQKAHYFARQAKQQHQLKKLNIELRQKYYEKWAINEDALAEYAQALATR